MDVTAARGEEASAAEETRLADVAAKGDGGAFAELYGRYSQCVYNLAYRIVGSEADAADAVQKAFLFAMRRAPQPTDRDVAFGSELLAATHKASHDSLVRRASARPSATRPAPGEECGQEDVPEASWRLPERQREALALRGLAPLSYGEIAAIMGINDHLVAQLISRARINLYDELRGTVLASVAPPSPECERALSLIVAREDDQLVASSPDAAWLDAHVTDCGRCRLAVEQIQEAGALYSAWEPIAIATIPLLLAETMAKVASLVGADWSSEIAEATAHARASPSPAAPTARRATPSRGRSRRQLVLATALAALLLVLVLAATALVGGAGSPVAGTSVSKHGSAAPAAGAKTGNGSRGRRDAAKKKEGMGAKAKKASTSSTQAASSGAPTPTSIPVQSTAEGARPTEHAAGVDAPGKAAVQPTHQTAASKPSSKPKPPPTSTTASQPATEPAPPPSSTPAESSAPAEEASEKPGRSGEAPGKPADHPSH